MQMPSNDHQWTGWMFVIGIPIYLLGMLYDWLSIALQPPWAWLQVTVESAHLTYGMLGYFLLFFLLVFPFVAKQIIPNSTKPVPQASIVLAVLGFLGYLIYQWDYFSYNFSRIGDENVSGWPYTLMIIIDFVLAPILGGIALCYSLITLTIKTVKFTVKTILAIADFFMSVYESAVALWRWLSSRFTRQARQEYRQEQAQQRHKEEARYKRENSQTGFDESRFNVNMPYGVDKRHPDVAKIWAMADDPANPPHVRKLWYAKALDKEAELETKKQESADIWKLAFPSSTTE